MRVLCSKLCPQHFTFVWLTARDRAVSGGVDTEYYDWMAMHRKNQEEGGTSIEPTLPFGRLCLREWTLSVVAGWRCTGMRRQGNGWWRCKCSRDDACALL
eukprot:2693917-Rhodomonas_salina.3